MNQHSFTVHCVTRPGQLLCLIDKPHDNWEQTVELLTSIPGGNVAKIVPLEDDGQILPIYQAMVQKRDVDYLVTVGDVPSELVTRIQQLHHLPHSCVVNEGSRLVEQWRQSTVPTSEGVGLYGYDLVNHQMSKGSSALPIPMTAVSGEVPAVRGTQVVLGRDGSETNTRAFELERVLQYYRRNLSDSDLGVPVLTAGNLLHDDLYVIVGTGDDVADLFLYWNMRRVPSVRRHGVWLPRHLFGENSLRKTLETLHQWILGRDIPLVDVGSPVFWRPGIVKFVSESPDICDRIAELSPDGWEWGTTGPLGGEIVHYVPQRPDMLLDARGVKYGQLDYVLASEDDGLWSMVLPDYPASYGTGAVSELNHRLLADLPGITLRTPTLHDTRTFLDGIAVYRNPHRSGRSEVVSISVPSPWEVFTQVLGPSIRESDKAPPVVALLLQVGGVDKCDFLEDQRVIDFLESAAMESVHRGLKSKIMNLLGTVGTDDNVEQEVDALVRTIGDEIRSRRKSWLPLNELERRGISKELLTWLYDRDLFVAGLKLKCPTCKGEGYYPPYLLADFKCSACGWRGKAPLVGKETPVFYSPRDLLLAVTATGGLPVVLTLLQMHRDCPTGRTYPGVKLPSQEGDREVDIVAWYSGQLFFYEVKHSGRHVHDALRLVKLCTEYGATPVFTAYEGTSKVASHLAEQGITDFLYFDLGRPVNRRPDPWRPEPSWKL